MQTHPTTRHFCVESMWSVPTTTM